MINNLIQYVQHALEHNTSDAPTTTESACDCNYDNNYYADQICSVLTKSPQ